MGDPVHLYFSKSVEHFDLLIYEATGLISGHSIKHILGAIAVLCVIFSFEKSTSNKK